MLLSNHCSLLPIQNLKLLNLFPVFSFLLVPLVASGEIDFNREIRPILSDKCYKCHGPDAKNQKSEFRLDSFKEAVKEHNGFVGLSPGSLEESEIHWRIHSDDLIDVMPPPDSKLPLTAQEKELIDQWIKEGGKYEKHWSFQLLPKSVEVPKSNHPTPRNEIDHFISYGLRHSSLQPSTATDKTTWLRRVTYDITGLPPSLHDVNAFLADSSKDAYEQVVHRLLNSDEYAERMTSEWMDVARYSDTYGYQVDRNREVWPWRDWVIQSFIKNQAYDQFVTEQIAGDLIPNATREQILATCFNRLHPQKVEGGSVPEEFRIEYVADRVHTFGTAFLGLSFECARCHDHKYDPITQKDYFSLSAFFNNIDEAGLYSFFTRSVPTPTLELKDLPNDRRIIEALEKANQIASSEEARKAFDNREGNLSKTLLARYPPLVWLSFDELVQGKIPNLMDANQSASTSQNNHLVPGKFGHAVQLTGDDAISLSKGVGDFNRHQAFSLSFWTQPTLFHKRAVVLKRSKAWTDAASRGYELLLENNHPSFALIHFWPGNALRVKALNAIPMNQWTHLAVTYDGSSKASGVSLFQNGQAIETIVVKDKLTREITGGGDPFITLGQRMRDRGFKNGMIDEFLVFERELSAFEISVIANIDAPDPSAEYEAFLRNQYDPYRAQLEILAKERKKWGDARQKIPEIMVMKEMPGLRETYILERGHYANRGKAVDRGTPEVLPAFPEREPANRLGLAKWLTSSDHPLMARVTVNRYWQMIFGRGLVSTSEDFGMQGKPPTHPELLDWLARDFVNSGWDLHHLIKKMVLSHTYGQESKILPSTLEEDPENLLLSRAPAHRLPAEMIRDGLLAHSGLLYKKIGGQSVKPYDLKVSFKPINPDKAPNVYRRSVYTFWKRTAPTPVMMAMDASKRDVCSVRREQTESPSQSLIMLNGTQFVESARATADSLVQKHGTQNPEDLIEEAFRRLTSRKPTKLESEILMQLLNEQKVHFNDSKQAEKFLKVGYYQAKSKELNYLAAVTNLVSTIMNFDGTISKR